ncbi:hypothetical protein KR032_012192 [Drosophila birchii]|nr:hypothetical protein KR032_012192 [Drosophila birchii]
MALSPKWEKNYERLVQAHHDDHRQTKILQRQLRRFMKKRQLLHKQIEHESQNTEVWMRKISNIRREMERVWRQRDHLTPTNRKLLEQILLQIPRDRLEDRVRLMEVSEKLMPKPCNDVPVGKSKTDLEKSKFTVNSQQKLCDPKTQPKVDKRLGRINADLQALRRINQETVDTMADIRVLKSIVQRLMNGTSVKISPYVVRLSSFDLKKAYPTDIKAIIAITRKNRNFRTLEKLDIRPPFILDHVRQLKPDTFKFLEMNSKRKP